MFSRSLRISLISLSLLALSLTGTKAQEQSYSPETIRNFIRTCTAGRGRQVELVCACYIRKIQAEYTLEEFREVNRNIALGRRPPQALMDIQKSCQANPNS